MLACGLSERLAALGLLLGLLARQEELADPVAFDPSVTDADRKAVDYVLFRWGTQGFGAT